MISNDEKTIAITNVEDGVELYSFPDIHPIKKLTRRLPWKAITMCSFIERTSILLIGGTDGKVHIFDTNSSSTNAIESLCHGSGTLIQLKLDSFVTFL
jgi:WD40 repeat protein